MSHAHGQQWITKCRAQLERAVQAGRDRQHGTGDTGDVDHMSEARSTPEKGEPR